MATIQINRRSNIDRRREDHQFGKGRGGIDRRDQAYNGYVLMIGEQGFDAISLFVILPIAVVLGVAFIASFMVAY